MIHDYWILTLLIGEVINVALLLGAVVAGIQIARKWDIGSDASTQLVLERRSYLVSTIMTYLFLFEMLSLWLFVITVNDHLPPLIKGAMCGTGALNANGFGWSALLLKIAEFILLALWLVVHYLDRRVPEYPLTKEKFIFLLLLSPLIIATALVEALYFLNINPNIITTCCSITFTSLGVQGRENVLHAAVDEKSLTFFLYLIIAINLAVDAVIYFSTKWLRRMGFVVTSATGIVFSVVAVATTIHHYAKYIYGMPSHHCPFDMLWEQYYFVGYPIYGLLLVAVISSLSVGFVGLVWFKREIQAEAISVCRSAAMWNAIAITLLSILLVLL